MSRNHIQISVIIPIYNAAPYLSQCLDSITHQTLKNIEIICVNNGSNDDSLKILQEYSSQDSRFTILNIPKSNAGTARNAGLAIARGEYLSFVDSDDYCEPTMLETVYKAAQKNKSDLVVFEFRTFDHQTQTKSGHTMGISLKTSKNTLSPSEIPDLIFSSFKNCPWNKLFRHQFIIDHKITFQEIPRSNDIFFTYMSLAFAQKITLIRQPLINYRINNSSSLQANNNLSPLSSWDACRQVKRQLLANDLYHLYEKSFLNEVLVNILYNLHSITQDTDAYHYLFNTIRYGAEIEFNFSNHKPSYYRRNYYQEYLDIIHTPSTTELIHEITSAKSYKIGLAITKISKAIKSLFTKH